MFCKFLRTLLNYLVDIRDKIVFYSTILSRNIFFIFYLEARIELSPTQYNMATTNYDDESEESAELPADHHRKRTKHNNNNGNNNNKRRRNKYDQIDHYDEDWRVDSDMDEFVPMPDSRQVASNTTTAQTTDISLSTTIAAGGGPERRVVAIVTLPPPPPRRPLEPAWSLSSCRSHGGGYLLPLMTVVWASYP